MPKITNIPAVLRFCRNYLGITDAAIAKKCGCHQTTINRARNGKPGYSLSMAIYEKLLVLFSEAKKIHQGLRIILFSASYAAYAESFCNCPNCHRALRRVSSWAAGSVKALCKCAVAWGAMQFSC